jgi:RNA polymerase sigma-70 factor (ECF subfamily)
MGQTSTAIDGDETMPRVTMSGSDPALLLEEVRGGSIEALGELYSRYSDLVYGLAYRVTGSRVEAEDVLQDLFVGLPHALRNYSERDRFEGWLKRVVVRTALMRIRAVRRKREEPLEELSPHGGAYAAGQSDPGLHPIDRIALQRVLERLPEMYRIVFVLKEIEGYSHLEIAELLGISSGNSATRLSRAWTILRKEVESR